jgi:hypothetical protein
VLPNASDFKGRGAEIKAGLKSNIGWNSKRLRVVREEEMRLVEELSATFPELERVELQGLRSGPVIE